MQDRPRYPSRIPQSEIRRRASPDSALTVADMKEYLFFDLDGTLTDSAPGIIRSAKYAMSHFGITLDDRTMHRFIGPPLAESFRNLCGLSERDSLEAIRLYREYHVQIHRTPRVRQLGLPYRTELNLQGQG